MTSQDGKKNIYKAERLKQVDKDGFEAKNRLIRLTRLVERRKLIENPPLPVSYEEIIVADIISFLSKCSDEFENTMDYEDIFTHFAFLAELFNSEWGLYIGTLIWDKIEEEKLRFPIIPKIVFPVECISCKRGIRKNIKKDLLAKNDPTCSSSCRNQWRGMEDNLIRAMGHWGKKGADFKSDQYVWIAYKFLCRKLTYEKTYTPIYYKYFPSLQNCYYPWWIDKANGRELANNYHEIMFSGDISAVELVDLDDYLKPEYQYRA